jgi:Secretion system C-terminal sorting domain/Ig-like domain CHU_C associated
MNNLTKKILFAAYMLAIAPALTFGADRPGKTNPTHQSATFVAEPVISGSVGSISSSGGTLSYSLAGGGGTVYTIAQLATAPAPTASAIKSADTAPTVATAGTPYMDAFAGLTATSNYVIYAVVEYDDGVITGQSNVGPVTQAIVFGTVTSFAFTTSAAPVTLTITGNATPCNIASLGYSVNSPVTGVTYTWSYVGGSSTTQPTISPATGVSTTVIFTASVPAGSLNVSGSDGSSGSFAIAPQVVASPPTVPVYTATGATSAVSITATNCAGTIVWSDASGTVLPGNQNPRSFGPFNNTAANAVQYTYRAQCNANGCLSGTVNLIIEAFPVPGPPQSISENNPQAICGTAADARGRVSLTANGCPDPDFVRWYDVPTGGSLLAQGKSPFLILTQDKTFYAACVVANYESTTRTAYTALYRSNPPAPTLTSSVPLLADRITAIICQNTTVTLSSSVTSGYGFSWERNGSTNLTTAATSGQGTPALLINAGGSYTLKLSSTIGGKTCEVYAKNTIVVVQEINPPKPVVLTDANFCEDKSTFLQSDSTANIKKFEWFLNDVKEIEQTTKFIRSFNKAGKIQVRVTDKNGCVSPFSDAIFLVKNALPTKPTITPSVLNASICQEDTVTITSSSAFSYKWNTGAVTQSIAKIKTAGKYALTVTDAKGCTSLPSDTLAVTVRAKPDAPTITASKTPVLCRGDNVTITSSNGFSYKWNTGATTSSIADIKDSGKYALVVVGSNGCVSKPSDTLRVVVNELPIKPVITASGVTSFCDGGKVDISSSTEVAYLWSTGDKVKTITITKDGTYSVKVTDKNGCISPSSDAFKVVVYLLPAKPTITASGSTTFCADKNVVLTSSSLVGGTTKYNWSTGDNTKTLTVKTSRTLTVTVTDDLNCTSAASDPTVIKVYELPKAPVVAADGPVTFCDGSKVNLLATADAGKLLWNNDQTTPSISIAQSGDFSVTLTFINEANNATNTSCVSPRSNVITVLKKDNPVTPRIILDGAYTLKAVDSPVGTDYEWKIGADIQKDAITELIKAGNDGVYSVRRRIVYAVPGSSLTCFSTPATYNFAENPDNKGFIIYPNPSEGVVTIETKGNWDNAEITLYDILGRIIYTGKVQKITGKLLVDLRNQIEGDYLLRLKADGFDFTRRIIINR